MRKYELQTKRILRKKLFISLKRLQRIKKKRDKFTDDLKKLIKEEGKGEEEINHPRYINNLVAEMMQLDKLLNEYETKINVTLEAKKKRK